MASVSKIEPAAASKLISQQKAIMVDIREPLEYAREHVIGARHVPLSGFDKADFKGDTDKVAIFCCKSGMRTARNAERILASGFKGVYLLEGGLDAWRKAGLPLHVNKKMPIEIMRQVQIVAGTLIVTGTLLGIQRDPAFFAIPAFVGTGFVFAGISGWCGMAKLLQLMPWNRI